MGSPATLRQVLSTSTVIHCILQNHNFQRYQYHSISMFEINILFVMSQIQLKKVNPNSNTPKLESLEHVLDLFGPVILGKPGEVWMKVRMIPAGPDSTGGPL